MLDKSLTDAELDFAEVRRAFDHAAASYDAHAVLQREVCDRLLERLDFTTLQPQRVLDIGTGTGYGLAHLQSRYAEAALCALDIAPAMLKRARARLPQPGWAQRALAKLHPGSGPQHHLLCADMDQLPLASSSINLAWSSLALQWAHDLDTTLKGIHRVLAPGGLLIFATFGPDTLKELRQSFAQLDGYAHVNTFPDMHDIGDWLMAAGFSAPVVDMEYITLTYATLRDMLREIKQIGANAVTGSRKDGLTGRQYWRQLENLYETHRREGRLPATWEVVYGHAWRPADRVAGMQPVIWHSRRPDGERA